ncbi:hypothetical protein ACLB2K_034357 [Fragaria x ananassa]
MAATQIPVVVLESSNGRRAMPVLGFGTASNNLEPEVLIEAVLEAIKLGYRHFDTASIYGSEQTLGEAVAKAISLGLIASRDELFITSKLWCNDAHPDLVIPALKKSLHCDSLLSIGWQWDKLGSSHVMESKVLQEIAEARGKTIAQVCIRWVYQAGATVTVKSYNKERLKLNVQVFDWELTEEDLDKISQIPQHRMMQREEFVSANGPYKSLEELWDGEILVLHYLNYVRLWCLCKYNLTSRACLFSLLLF